jgi:MFS transporter, putative metabolite transport protein
MAGCSASSAWHSALHLSGTDLSAAGAAALIGIFISGLVFGRVTKVIGRQLMYTIDRVAPVVCSILCAFVTALWQIIVLRFVIGADYPIATTLLAEWLPVRKRAANLGSPVVAWFAGSTVAT